MSSPTKSLCGLDIPSLLREFAVPGCSVAILDRGDIVEERAFGIHSAAHPTPVTPHTLFQAGSISKPVSVFGALRLVDAGELTLDTDVNDRLTTWTIPANGDWRPRVTLRQLASHTAGLTTHGFPGYPADARLPSLEQVLSGTAPANSTGVRVDILPGVQYRYSGGGTTVMQLLLETATGITTAHLLNELVLTPLGMRSSTFAQPLPPEYADHAAHGNRADGTPVPGGWYTYPEQCAAGLWTTPADLLRFARGIQDAATGTAHALLSPDMIGQMLRPCATVPEQTNPTIRRNRQFDAIGLGPFLRIDDDVTTWFGHSGGTTGFRCQLIANVRTGQAAAVMTNGDVGTPVIDRVFQAIAGEYGWAGIDVQHPDQPVALADPDGSIGDYVTGSGVRVELSRVPGATVVAVGDQPPVRLIPVSATELLSAESSVIVRLDGGGGITLEQGGQTTACARVPDWGGGAPRPVS